LAIDALANTFSLCSPDADREDERAQHRIWPTTHGKLPRVPREAILDCFACARNNDEASRILGRQPRTSPAMTPVRADHSAGGGCLIREKGL
jgi:hypothetical protein